MNSPAANGKQRYQVNKSSLIATPALWQTNHQ